MKRNSNFSDDKRKERLLASYLDGVYDQLHITSFRINDKQSQLKGIDALITNRYGRKYIVDEKSQLDYLNLSLETFAFEIGYLNRYGKHKQGWLFDLGKETTHYMLVTGITLKHKKEVLENISDITSVKLLWLNRAKLLSALSEIGINQTYCDQTEQDARRRNVHGHVTINYPDHYFYLTLEKKAEAPFNLVIKRDWLLQFGFELI